MKRIFFFLVITVLFIGCKKQETDAVQPRINSDDSISAESLGNTDVSVVPSEQSGSIPVEQPPGGTDVSFILPEQFEGMPLQEIIENYHKWALPGNNTWRWEFQIEGNFTGSGNREIIGFYGRYAPVATSAGIGTMFCFVCDPSGEKIESVHRINYVTVEFRETDEAITGLSEDLGKFIVFRGRIIGCVGDFNRNGKDELYLFSLSGFNFVPYFYEFDGTGFSDIIELNWGTYRITIADIDPVEGIIALSEIRRWDGPPPADYPPNTHLTEIITSYIWNEAARLYEAAFSETKNYSWNRDLWEYEEIEE